MDELVPYVKKMGYTHIELYAYHRISVRRLLGYQVTGFFSATTRYGESEDLKYLIDMCQKNHIGIIMDWAIAHFPRVTHTGTENV